MVLEDEITDVLYGILFTADCGCQVEFGIRHDTAGRVLVHKPCKAHCDRTAQLVKTFITRGQTPSEGHIEALLR